MSDSIFHMRLAKIEAMINYQKSRLPQTIEHAYKLACDKQDTEEAAYYARIIRNKLLDECDKEMTLDRLGLEAPNGTTFSAWLEFLKGLGALLSNPWAQYRQALRDLPLQEGFPFNIQFPDRPNAEHKTEEVSENDE